MYSKDLELVINRIRREIARQQSYIGEMYQGKRNFDEGFIKVAKEYEEFASEIIKLIKEVDGEIKEREEN